MNHEEQVEKMKDIMAKFLGHTAIRLPDDVIEKLEELRDKEDTPPAKVIYRTMFRNQMLAEKLQRPSCQDTGLVQIFVTVGSRFPHTEGLADALKTAIYDATQVAPLRKSGRRSAATRK